MTETSAANEVELRLTSTQPMWITDLRSDRC